MAHQIPRHSKRHVPETSTRDALQNMMKPYHGPNHTVVGFSLRDGAGEVVNAGTKPAKAPAGDWIFEIGSITKLFTAILLCVLIEEGEVDPQAPLSEMSPDLSTVPKWITPESLTTHTSGLPNFYLPLWKVLFSPLQQDPYANFSRSDLLSWFQNWSGKDPGTKRRHAYSNLGVGLLGEAMAMKTGMSFPDLLARKVTGPLGLGDTTARLSAEQISRLMQPRSRKGDDVPAWTFDALAGAGALRSSANDLIQFSAEVLRALDRPQTALDRAIYRSVEPLVGLGRRGALEPKAQCSGWISLKLDRAAPRMLHHDGATAGSTCTLYICPEKAAALGILSNNCVAGNLWASTKLSWSNPGRQALNYFVSAPRRSGSRPENA